MTDMKEANQEDNEGEDWGRRRECKKSSQVAEYDEEEDKGREAGQC